MKDREKLVRAVEVALMTNDENNDYRVDKILVNFFDDEIYYERIAEVAVDTLLKELHSG